jgi:hypothetical protein
VRCFVFVSNCFSKEIVSRQQAVSMLVHEASVGCLLAAGLFFVGFVRVLLTRGGWSEEAAREALTIGNSERKMITTL